MPGGGGGAAGAFPGVERDVVVVAAGGQEHRAVAHALLFLQPDRVAPEAEGAVEVGDLQVDMADPRAGVDGGRWR